MKINLKAIDIAAMIDFSLLKPDMTDDDIKEGIDLAAAYGAGVLCVRPTDVPLCRKRLPAKGPRLASVAGFPHGCSPTAAKIAEAQYLLDNGCDEIDMVLNIAGLKSGDLDFVRGDIAPVLEAVRQSGKILKVIFENCYLTQQEKLAACSIVSELGVDFAKTSTGFGPSGATLEDIRLMRANIKPEIGIKASGGIRSLNNVLSCYSLGATRIGTSALKEIVEEARRLETEGALTVSMLYEPGEGY